MRSAWVAVLAAPMALCAAALAVVPLNHDAAWYLHMASVWLDGGTLYRDVVDTNPPLIVFLSAPSVVVARALGVLTPPVFTAWVFGLAVFATFLSVPAIRRIWTDGAAQLLIAGALVFGWFPFAGAEFGQREHLAAIFTAPFVFNAAAWAIERPVPPRLDALCGVLAGLGFALKPHFVVSWLAVESVLLVIRPWRGWRRGATAWAAITIVVYLVLVGAIAPDYVRTVREVVAVYGGLNRSLGALARVPELPLWGLALLIAASRIRTWSAAAVVLFFAATGFFVAGLFQMKGWGYHFYPFRFFVVLFFASVVVDLTGSVATARRASRWTQAAAGAVLIAIVAWSARAYVKADRSAGSGYVAEVIRLLNREPRAESMALLSMRFLLFPAFPAVNYTRTEWVLRHNSLWFLPGLYAQELMTANGGAQFRPVGAMPPLERKYFEEIVGDLCARPPRILLVDAPAAGEPPRRGSLDLLGYYGQDARFAVLMTGYDPADVIGPFIAYRRVRQGGCSPGEGSR